LLAPRLVNAENVADRKKHATTYAAQDQQRPVRVQGQLFRRERWRYWRFASEPPVAALEARTVVLPDREEWAQHFDSGALSVDCSSAIESVALAAARGSLDSLHVWARRGANRYLLDLRWAKYSPTDARAAVRELVSAYPWIGLKLIEAAANGRGLVDGLTAGAESLGQEALSGVAPVTASASKVVRAFACEHLFVGGNVYLPLHHARLEEMHGEGDDFPREGKRNDFIDAMTQYLNHTLEADKTGNSEGLYD
jgi:predicted phage terminase large subunit-like protein